MNESGLFEKQRSVIIESTFYSGLEEKRTFGSRNLGDACLFTRNGTLHSGDAAARILSPILSLFDLRWS
jgi:hypothetical protein